MIRIYTQEPSSIIPFSFIGQFGRKIRIIQGGMWLLLSVPLWFAMSAIAPENVQAYTARVDLGIESLPDENYETVLGRAEMVARAAAQRSFDQDILVTDVSIIVTVQSHGLIAPVLALDVSRVQWKQRPDPQRWVTYFKTARSLLLFGTQTALPDPAPAVPPTVKSPAVNQPTPTTP
ncbi:hypothetical protein [Trichormus variabilis]|uniref:Uncharacterized protein n=1 Tax=Trichormus variabilis SAG 1403-4b TaxID=447716 RepID=A0A433USX5_ANAVA|nr:hypothetical protein [Trichormus variabilis]MBD2628233.1 hypothetical protein [Trichormus variabilis FACHB-164]RUS96953.1 hypothetical protein DSM107003_23590 [Trichormus variabilis SAG 1403-4b]